MKFDQDLRLNLQYDFGKMNSTLGSVVPLAMFNQFSPGTPSEGGAVGLASPINSLCPSCKMPFDRFCLLFDMSQENCQDILGFKILYFVIQNLELAQVEEETTDRLVRS